MLILVQAASNFCSVVSWPLLLSKPGKALERDFNNRRMPLGGYPSVALQGFSLHIFSSLISVDLPRNINADQKERKVFDQEDEF